MALSDTGFRHSTTATSAAIMSYPTPTLPDPTTMLLPFEDSPITSPTLSPTKAAPPPASEAATTARRERKVLDLEISNSSLLAINRTLEREMRKQTTELRRFRRLSRSGRLSIRTLSGQSKKSSLGILAEDGEDDDAQALLNGLEGMDLGDSDDDDDVSASDGDEDADSSFSPTASGSASSNLSSGHALAQRKRDEKRLMLDLSKHRQLLIDSEKMNSSIRRCTAWTEEMIREVRVALEYTVKVGGRVLEHDSDSEEDKERGMGLVSPCRVVGRMKAESLLGNAQRRGEPQAEQEGDEGMSPIDAGGVRAEPVLEGGV